MPNLCPRDQEKLMIEKVNYGGIEVHKQICTVCGTRFFFDEDIQAFLMKMAVKPETTVKTAT